MSEISLNSSALGSSLAQLLLFDEINPGDDASYQACKTILLWHPLGRRMAGGPVKLAQSQPRDIIVQDAPAEVVERFVEQWALDKCDDHIAATALQARAYGVASLGFGARDVTPDKRIAPLTYAKRELFFSTFDPLNTAGSLVLNQDPNSPDYQKHGAVTVNGVPWHRSRTVVLQNEEPIYIAYTQASFGYTGRSVYQRALYPLKSFLAGMIADDMILQKLGLLIAKQKSPGSIVDRLSQAVGALKRTMLKGATTGNVLSIGTDEDIETLNMMNVEGAGGYARTNVIKNIATAADMPATLLLQDTLAEGFGEGTEDAKTIATYIGGIRTWMKPLYDFMDSVEQYRAWNEDFFVTMQTKYPALYGGVSYKVALARWQQSFRASWPNLITEPDSEKIKVEETKFKTVIGVAETLLPILDPENKATLVDWVAQSINDRPLLFETPLQLDIEALKTYVPPVPGAGDGEEGEEPKDTKFTLAA